MVLVNSNPATIMTDPEFADATYIEPITPEVVEEIIARERPDALLPTIGGQTALNVTMQLHRAGVLDRYGVELIGAGIEAIERAEDRGRFKQVMEEVGLEVPRAGYARSMVEAIRMAEEIGFPVMVRPSFILGGGGTGIAHDPESFIEVARKGLDTSPVGEILVEESVYGWKEFELEVMRDRNDNAVIVCSIENLDPMGVHTGDSITVAPIQTLSDREYQEMRDDGIKVLRAIGVETGGSNVQFAVDPATGRRLVIEMNPRVSRSSALASKATGFPIAKIAALLAVGYTLDEIPNDITGATPASFEPALDYVVVKIPRFDFAKFPSAPDRLGTSMRSVGEAMAIGRTFPEALQKALRSLENGRFGLNGDPGESSVMLPVRRGAVERRRGAHPRTASSRWARPCGGGSESKRWRRPASSIPGSSSRWPRSSTCRKDLESSGFSMRSSAGRQAARLFRSPARLPLGPERGRGSQASTGGRHPHDLQDGRHLCGRIRGPHALHVRHLRGRGRGAAGHQAPGGGAGVGTQPDRTGHRVRLLLRPRLVRAAETPATRPSWSTAIRRRFRRTTTPPIGSTSSP